MTPRSGDQPQPSAAAVLPLEDPVTPATVQTLARRLDAVLDDGTRVVVIDLLAVAPIDNPTLARLIGAVHRTLRHPPATIAIASTDPRTRWVVELCQLDKVEVHPTIPAALSSHTARPGGRERLTRPLRSPFRRLA